ncbi:MAG: hypothetical protein Tsb0015_12370 [Simkaniaceae bacterium]
MSLFLTRFGVAVAVAGYGAAAYAENKYPPQGTDYKYGKKYLTPEGEKYFIGYTGHDIKTFSKIDPNKGIYYGDKMTAQRYAKINGGINGAVGHIFADKTPGIYDHAMQNFEGGHEPLSGEGFRRINATIINPELVTSATEVGKLAALKRMLSKS